MTERGKRALIVPLAAIAYVVGQAVSGMALAGTPVEPPQIDAPPGVWGLVSALILALGVAPLAGRLDGGPAARWCVLAAFLFLVHTANTAIETIVFTKIGGQGYMAAMGLLPAALCAALVAAVRPAGGAPPSAADGPRRAGLAWRLAVAWLAFPVAYFVFGMMIAPLAIETYSAEDSMIVIPPLSTIIATQAIRSMLYLLPTLAVVERWRGTRWGLWLALGWAHWALVGLSGLAMPSEIMTPMLRLVHAVEIGGDSFVYSGIVVAVLAPACRPRASPETP